MNINELLGPLSAELATEEMEDEMLKSLGKTREQIIAEYGNEFKIGSGAWEFYKTAPQYNGVPGDECPCPACNYRRNECGADTDHDKTREIPGNDVAGSPLPPGANTLDLTGLPEGVMAIPMGRDDRSMENLVGSLERLFGLTPVDDGPIPDKYHGINRIREHMIRYGKKKARKVSDAKLDLADMREHAAKAVYAAEQIINQMPIFLAAIKDLREFVNTMSESPEISEAMEYSRVFHEVEKAEKLVFGMTDKG